MKKLTIYSAVFLIILGGFALTGCYKDVILPATTVDPDGPPQAVSFSKDLAPIFNSQCALVGCHVDGSHKPYLKTDVSYLQIVNGGFVNLLVPKESILYKNVYGAMKEYMPDRKSVV